ncbi:hypothetical protein AB0H92_22110 [Streptomyces phaeochromogenes]|uniref:hypothetical protein n=1 Tax=Streptomyces phaeochromogenes TaxID=1923 RepID=UPI0033EDF18D
MDPLALLRSSAAVNTRGQLRRQVPAAAIVFLIAALLASGAPARSPSPGRVLRWAEGLKGVELTLLVLTVAAVSLFLQPVLNYIADVLKGASPSPGSRLSRLLNPLRYRRRREIEYQRQRLQELASRIHGGDSTSEETAEFSALDVALSRWPARYEYVLPTALGNLLAAVDDYPELRYGMDVRVTLPRLRSVAPPEVNKQLDDQLDDLQFSIELAAALILGAGASACLLASHPLWLLLPICVLLLAWLAYRNALAAGVQYGEGVRVLFDLYRFRLYEALRMQLPDGVEAEKEANKEMTLWLWRGFDPGISYHHPLPPPGQAASGS